MSIEAKQEITDALIARVEANSYVSTNSIDVNEFRDNSTAFTPPAIIVRVYNQLNSITDAPLYELDIDIMCMTHQADDLSGSILETLYQNMYALIGCGSTLSAMQNTFNVDGNQIKILSIEINEDPTEDQYDIDETIQAQIVKGKIYIQTGYYAPVIHLRQAELSEDFEVDEAADTWRDAGMNNITVTQSTESYRALYKTSPVVSLKFDGSNDYYPFNDVIPYISTKTTGAIHLKVRAFNGGEGILTLGNSSALTGLYIYDDINDDINITFYIGGVVQWQHTSSYPPGSAKDIKIIHNGIQPTVYVDNVDVTSFDVTTNLTRWFSAITGFNQARLGVAIFPGFTEFYAAGYITDFKIFDSAVTTEQIDCI